MLLSAQVRGAVARARAVPVGRVCAVYSGWGDVLVSVVFVPRWVALEEAGQGVTGCVFYGVGQASDVGCGIRKVLLLHGAWGAHGLRGALE